MEKEEILKSGKLLFLILNDYLTDKKSSLNLSSIEVNNILKIAKLNSILALTYLALKKDNINLSIELDAKLNEYYSKNLRKTILFDEERKELYSFLNDNKIWFLPLKGIIINKLYPDYGSREFADNDILFDSTYKKEIKNYFTSKGYEVESYNQGVHDTYLKKPFYNFEMHNLLFQDSMNDKSMQIFEEYFKDYYQKTIQKENFEREVTNEDFFIYFISHFYKHYSHGGAGIRTLIDIKIYLLNYPNLNKEYLKEQFTKLKINDFVNEILNLINHLFSNCPLSENENNILLYMITNGTYGTIQTNISNSLKKESKFKYVLHRLFPPMSYYKTYYPKIYKTKILIPLIWFKRLFRGIFKNKKKIKEELKTVKSSK